MQGPPGRSGGRMYSGRLRNPCAGSQHRRAKDGLLLLVWRLFERFQRLTRYSGVGVIVAEYFLPNGEGAL